MDIIDLTQEEGECLPVLAIEVTGPPPPMPRMRYYRGGFYNSAKKSLLKFRGVVSSQIPGKGGVPFPRGVLVSVKVKFYMRRPLVDFKNGSRVCGAMKSLAPFARPTRPDIDNLVKYVLDGLNGIAYEDDRQVVKLEAYKLLDNEAGCEGRTTIEIREFVAEDN